MNRRIGLNIDGVVAPIRMQPVTPGEATKTPGVKLGRLKQLISGASPRICVVRGEGIGDVIMTTPTVAALKTTIPNAHLTYATNTRYLDGALVKVLLHNPFIDNIIDRNDMDESYDIVVNLHCPAISYEKRENPPLNRIDIFANHAGVKLVDPKPQYYITQAEIESGHRSVEAIINDRLILVQPFASTPNRSPDHLVLKQALVELYQKHGIRSIVTTHSGGWKSDTLWDNIPGGMLLHNANIRQIAGIMVHCNLVLCPDSSILHLAGALSVPTLSLFGTTHPAARVNHYKDSAVIWGGEGLAPCPCWYADCPIGHTCWKRITTERIVSGCLSQLSQTKRIQPTSAIKPKVIHSLVL